jgi:cell division protein ZapA
MGDRNKVEVEIFNQKFTLFSENEGGDRLKKLAKFVDKRMRDIYKTTRLSSAIKIAILTALNLADDLVKEKETKVHSHPDAVNRIMSLVDRMESIMAYGEEKSGE